MSNDRLTSNDKIDITIQSALQLVPYIGGALSTAYFGTKQEKRLKRIESFYQEFSEFIEQTSLNLPSINQHDENILIALIEELNEKIERESTIVKRTFFKNYLYNTLRFPTNQNNFDEKRFFLDVLAKMTILECELLMLLKRHNGPIKVGDISKQGLDQYAIVAAIGRLKINGFIQASTSSFVIGNGSDNSLLETVSVSNFGNNFINYCLYS